MFDYRDIVEFVLFVFRKKPHTIDQIIEDPLQEGIIEAQYGIRELLEEARQGKQIPAAAVSGKILKTFHFVV